jgi:hypothetical protein
LSERLAANAQPDPRRFALLLGQLALLLIAFRTYHIEGPVFFVVAAVSFGGFAVHYWLPVAWKERFFVALSVAGAFLVLEPLTAALVLGTGVLIWGITRLPVSWGVRLGIVLALGAVLLWRWAGRAWERQPEREDEPPSPDPREPELLQDAA